MSPTAKTILEKVASWPEEDQEELAEVAREIEARRTGFYILSDGEQTAVDEGLQQLRRGQFAPENEMLTFWKRFGVV
jgi:site-specific DNA-adenine methylase